MANRKSSTKTKHELRVIPDAQSLRDDEREHSKRPRGHWFVRGGAGKGGEIQVYPA